VTSRRPYALMKLCHAADAFGYKLTGLLNRFGLMQPELIDELVAEVNNEQGNVSVVYAGRCVDLL